MFSQDTTTITIIMAALLCVLVILGIVILVIMIKQLKRNNRVCQDNSYLIQKMPNWIKDSVSDALKPELDSMRRSIDNYAKTSGESQYAMRIAQSAEHFNRSLAEINSSVSVTLTDALGGFDTELQATLTELLETMKRLRAVTNNIPKIIDNSFAEMQRSFDEMEGEMQKTINAFRDMRVKIEAQQAALGPVQPGMVRETPVQPEPSSTEATTQKRRWLSNLSGNKSTPTAPVQASASTVSPSKPIEGIKSKPTDTPSKMDFSNY